MSPSSEEFRVTRKGLRLTGPRGLETLTVRGHFRVLVKGMTALLLNHSLSKVAYVSVHIAENEVIEDISWA